MSPGVKRHRERRQKTDKPLIPIVDPRVFKDSAVRIIQKGVEFLPWTHHYDNALWEYHGYISAFQVPWTYLSAADYQDDPDLRASHTLRDVIGDMVLNENTRLPNDHVLGYTFGIDPKMWKMVTAATRVKLTEIACQKYWEAVPGHRLRSLGIGPTGFDLTQCKDYHEDFEGQRGAFIRLARAAQKSGKCLSLHLTKDTGAGNIDIHEEARKVLRELNFDKVYPIHLQTFVATYDDLCSWLDEFPNTVIAFDYRFIDNLVSIADQLKDHPNHVLSEHYAPVMGLLEFLKRAPLENIVVQSGAYEPTTKRILRQPGDVTAAVGLLERTTGTAQEVLLERSAVNSARVYKLTPELFDHAVQTEDRRPTPRSTIQTLHRAIRTEMLRLGLAPPPLPPPAQLAAAPRADLVDQENTGHRSADPPAYSAGGQPGGEAQVVLSIPPRSKSASRSPGGRIKDVQAVDERKNTDPVGRRPRSRERKPPVKAKKTETPKKEVERRSSSLSSSSSSSADSWPTSSRSSSSSRTASEKQGGSKKPTPPPPRAKAAKSRSRSRSRSTDYSRRSHRRSTYAKATPADLAVSAKTCAGVTTKTVAAENVVSASVERKKTAASAENESAAKTKTADAAEANAIEKMTDGPTTTASDTTIIVAVRTAEAPGTLVNRLPNIGRAAETPHEAARPADQNDDAFVMPKYVIKPVARPPIQAPETNTPCGVRARSTSSRGSGSNKQAYLDRLPGRVVITKAVTSGFAPYQAVPPTQRSPAYSAGAAGAVRWTSTDDLLKPHALPAQRIVRPKKEEIERYVDTCLADEIADSRLGLRTVLIEELSTDLIDPRKTSPYHRNDRGIPPTAAPQRTRINRWKTHAALQDQSRAATLQAIGALKVHSFGHMILVTWAVYLGTDDDRIWPIVVFIYRVLQTHDWEKEIPALLVEYQPHMVLPKATAPWPNHKNFKNAAEKWVCCCQHAFQYVFDHLTGPITFAPRWLDTDHVAADFRTNIRDEMIGKATIVFNNLRHVIYRQYGVQHVHATLERRTLGWKRLDKTEKRETTRNGTRLDDETIVFAEKSIYDLFSSRLKNEVYMVSVPVGDHNTTLRSILDYFPGDVTRRVVFWIGRSYIVEGNHGDYDELMQELCHVYSAYCGYVEQHVVLPAYIRSHYNFWASRVLRLLVQQSEIVPHAHVAVFPEDLQLYDRDRRLTTRAPWDPSIAISTDGLILTAASVKERKSYLKDEHKLDLWTNYVEPSTNTAPPLIDYSAAPAPDAAQVVAAYSAAPLMQATTSATIAAPTAATTGTSAAYSAAAGLPQLVLPTAIVPTGPGTSASAAAPDPNALLATAMATLLQQQQQNQQLAQLVAQLLGSQTTTVAEQPKKKDSSRKDHRKDPRE